VIDARGVTLSAGVALFDAVLAVEAAGKAEESEAEALGEEDPVVCPASNKLPQHGDDGASREVGVHGRR
jgi:hypothetical protein